MFGFDLQIHNTTIIEKKQHFSQNKCLYLVNKQGVSSLLTPLALGRARYRFPCRLLIYPIFSHFTSNGLFAVPSPVISVPAAREMTGRTPRQLSTRLAPKVP